MRIAIIGDIHGSIRNLKRAIRFLKKSNLIFITGDIISTVSFSLVIKSILKFRTISREKYVDLVYGDELQEFTKHQKKSAIKIFQIISKLNIPTFFTHGNSETKEIREIYSEIADENANIYYIENGVLSYNNYIIAGYGYCSPSEYRTPFKTPGEKTEKEIEKDLNSITEKISNTIKDENMLVFGLFHEPPYETKLDYMFQKGHVGSKLIKKHIEETRYDYIFSGHIHESQNFELKNNILMINPGPLINGEIGILNLKQKEVQLRRIPCSSTLKGIVYRTRGSFA